MTVCHVYRLGVMEYQAAWDLQRRWAGEIGRGERPATLLLLEHPHTYTFGRRGDEANLLWDEAERTRRGVQVHWVDRGGDVTYHGPGQLVGYPLLPLAPGGLHTPAGEPPRLPQADYVGYLRRLEAALIAALGQFGLAARTYAGLTGVWLPAAEAGAEAGAKPAKIAAIGVKVDVHGVSQHGFALNVAAEMEYWEGIVGCGLAGYPVTSLAQALGREVGLAEVMDAVCAAFGAEFGYSLIEKELESPSATDWA